MITFSSQLIGKIFYLKVSIHFKKLASIDQGFICNIGYNNNNTIT